MKRTFAVHVGTGVVSGQTDKQAGDAVGERQGAGRNRELESGVMSWWIGEEKERSTFNAERSTLS